MTTSSNKPRGRKAAGFTLVEVLIAATLGGIILTGVMSSFLMIGRSGAVLYNYVGMEAQARRGLETFGEDTRMASAMTWTADASGTVTSVSLTIPHVASDSYNNTVTYTYNSSAGTFVRAEAATNSSGVSTGTTTSTLLQNVSTLAFNGWISGSSTGTAAAFSSQTDELQISLTLRVQANQYGTATGAVASASNLVVSARYIMRNKRTT